jgi:hypothetical protein
MESLNKTIAKFRFKGRNYEIDWMTDMDHSDGYREYDIFETNENVEEFICHISTQKKDRNTLIKIAKEEIESYIC